MPNLKTLQRRARKAGWDKPWTPNDLAALEEGCYYDAECADHVVTFIERFCRLSQGRWAGEKIHLLDWQRDGFLKPLYGWRRPDGTRRYRRAYVTVAKKNGKSSIASTLEIYGLMGEGEEGAEIYTAATSRDQAGIVHKEASNMIRLSPDLRSRLKVIDHTKTILYGTNAWIRALAADAATSEGLKTQYLIIDEFHAWSGNLKSFYDSLRWSMAARVQPLTLVITTRGDDIDGTMCGELDRYAQRVLSGDIINTSFFGLIFAPDENDNINDPATWRKANPSLGYTISEADFKRELEEAKDAGPADLAAFERYRLNKWRSASSPWLPALQWGELGLPLEESDFYGMQCWGGLDLSSKEDLTALAWWFNIENIYYLLTRQWVPEAQIEKKLRAGDPRYRVWADAGFLKVCPGIVIDQELVFDQIREDAENFNIQELAFDRWNADQMAMQLSECGVQIVQFGQGFKSFSEPTKAFKSSILNGTIRHADNPCFNWQISNVHVAEDPAENVKPIKKDTKTRYKIDGPVAAIMGFSCLLLGGQKEEPSRYNNEGEELFLI